MQNHCLAYLWALTKIRFVNRCHPEALSRSLSMAKNLHLNCIFHTAWCTAPQEVQKEPGRVLEQRHNVLWSTNRRQVQSEAGPIGNLHLLLVIFVFLGFYQDLICGITSRHVMPCGHMNTDVVSLEKQAVQSVSSGSSLAQSRCGNVIWQAGSKTKENKWHSAEGSLPDIHWPNGPISTAITVVCSSWAIRQQYALTWLHAVPIWHLWTKSQRGFQNNWPGSFAF